MAYQPPFTLTPAIIELISNISEQLGRLSIQGRSENLRLRRINHIRTIQGSLAIEGNTLSEQQITAIIDGKAIIAPPQEIQEVRNATLVYQQLTLWKADSETDLLSAHQQLMKGLVDDAGYYRQGNVGVMKGDQVIHMAPPANRVPILMNELINWLSTTDVHPLIRSCVFHYEFEFIHPFSDGNGRMGRLWQTLILSRWKKLLAQLPVESEVFKHQSDYYAAINQSTIESNSSPFIHFMLTRIYSAITASLDATVETSVETSVEKNIKTPDKILALLQQQPKLSLSQVAQIIGLSLRAVERAVAKLKNEGQLSFVGPKKDGYWTVNNKT